MILEVLSQFSIGSIYTLFGGIYLISFLSLILAILMAISCYRIYQKAGRKGWEALIPIYNLVVLFKIVGIRPFMIFLLIIPFVNIIFSISVMIKLASSFGKSTAYGLGLVFLPFLFYPLLAFSSDNYISPNGEIRYDAPQPTSSDYSKPQNYKDVKEDKKEEAPVISMGGGQTFNVPPIIDHNINYVQNNSIPDFSVEKQTDFEKASEVSSSLEMQSNMTPSFIMPEVYGNVPKVESVSEETTTNQTHTILPQFNSDFSATDLLNTPEPPKQETFISNSDSNPFSTLNDKVCPNCGARLNPDSKQCFLCGYQV